MPGSSKLAFGLAIFLSAAIVGQLIVIYLQQSMSPAAQYAAPTPPTPCHRPLRVLRLKTLYPIPLSPKPPPSP